jgi:hypothetical protein
VEPGRHDGGARPTQAALHDDRYDEYLSLYSSTRELVHSLSSA